MTKKLSDKELTEIIIRIQSGDDSVIEEIYKEFKQAIDSNSYINGKFDEDLQQIIKINIYMNIPKFKI